MLHKLSLRFAYAADGEAFVDRFNLCNRRWGYPIGLSWDAQNSVYICGDGANEIRVARKERVQLYFRGIDWRLRRLAEHDYMLGQIPFSPGDVVIDCGANVGEVGKFLAETRACRVIAVEPDPDEFRCLTLNVAGDCRNIAMWNEEGEMRLYLKNATGDSSLFPPPGDYSISTVRTTTLKRLLSDASISRVKLLKLEAEGAEPEIVQGAGDRLQMIDYIAADLGPERGLRQEPTVVPVVNHLLSRGFRLLDMRLDRVVCLFKRGDL
jgi:FkbM family methyltransferase